MQPVNHFL
jgi:hypothetical protein